jgi:hypothetical protein
LLRTSLSHTSTDSTAFSQRLSKFSDCCRSQPSKLPLDRMDPVGPDDPDMDSILGTARNNLSEATMDIVRRPNPQPTLNLDALGAAKRIVASLIAIYTTPWVPYPFSRLDAQRRGCPT